MNSTDAQLGTANKDEFVHNELESVFRTGRKMLVGRYTVEMRDKDGALRKVIVDVPDEIY